MRLFTPLLLALITLLAPVKADVLEVQKPQVVIYTIPNCLGCTWAKSFFRDKGIPFEEVDIKGRPDLYREMKIKAGGKVDDSMTVPRIFVNGKHLGSSTDLNNDSLKALMSEPVNTSIVKSNEDPLKKTSKHTDS